MINNFGKIKFFNILFQEKHKKEKKEKKEKKKKKHKEKDKEKGEGKHKHKKEKSQHSTAIQVPRHTTPGVDNGFCVLKFCETPTMYISSLHKDHNLF
mgnify:CR=1 FL=1